MSVDRKIFIEQGLEPLELAKAIHRVMFRLTYSVQESIRLSYDATWRVVLMSVEGIVIPTEALRKDLEGMYYAVLSELSSRLV